MRHFIKHFVRESDGSWRCVDSATLEMPSGRIQVAAGARFTPGTSFMGYDLARMLDEELEQERDRQQRDGGATLEIATLAARSFPHEDLRRKLEQIGIAREHHEQPQLVRLLEGRLGAFKNPDAINVNDAANTLITLLGAYVAASRP
jgi:hypothetical protein